MEYKVQDIRIEITENGASVKWCEVGKDPKKPYDDRYSYKEVAFVKGVEGEYAIDKIGAFVTQKIYEAIGTKDMKMESEEEGNEKSETEIKIEVK